MGIGELRIEMLGPLQVTVGENPADFRTDAERALLAYLAAHQGIPQRRDTLAALLSPDRDNTEALTYLRNRLTRLRGALDDARRPRPRGLILTAKQITLRAGDNIRIDVTQFDQRLAAVETHAHRQLAGCPTCLARLQESVALVRGEFLAGLNFPSETWESWTVAQREHLQQRTLEAMTWLREARMARGEWAAVLDVAHRQLGPGTVARGGPPGASCRRTITWATAPPRLPSLYSANSACGMNWALSQRRRHSYCAKRFSTMRLLCRAGPRFSTICRCQQRASSAERQNRRTCSTCS